MDQGLKQRLVGAGVIIALAVIFIPAILDSPDRQQGANIDTIPPEPFVVIRRIEAPDRESLERLEAEVSAERIPDPGVVVEVDAEIEPENTVQGGLTPKPSGTAPLDTENRTEAARAALSAERSSAEQRNQQEPAQPSAQPPAGLATSWSVQLGAFSQQANANRLYNKLLEDGYHAYLDPTKPPGKILYRVYVGPEIRQERANHLRDALRKAYGLNGLVVRYSP